MSGIMSRGWFDEITIQENREKPRGTDPIGGKSGGVEVFMGVERDPANSAPMFARQRTWTSVVPVGTRDPAERRAVASIRPHFSNPLISCRNGSMYSHALFGIIFLGETVRQSKSAKRRSKGRRGRPA